MKMLPQTVKVIIAAILSCALMTIAFFTWQKRRYESAYGALVPYTHKALVLKQFGKPKEIKQCTLKPSWDAKPLPKQPTDCLEEFWYFSRISPEQWIISFDKDGRAISKYYFTSP